MCREEILRGRNINGITNRIKVISPLDLERTVDAVCMTIFIADEVIGAVCGHVSYSSSIIRTIEIKATWTHRRLNGAVGALRGETGA